jgi:hypothetical protein
MTATVTLTPHADYVLVVPAGKTWFTVSSTDAETGDDLPAVRIVRTAADATAPSATELGHRLKLDAGATRGLFPDGALWAKVIGGRSGYLAVDFNA